MYRYFINLKNRYYQKSVLRGLFLMSFPQGIVAWIPKTSWLTAAAVVAGLPESSLRGGTKCRRGNPVKHIFILNLFNILIKSLITFGIAWIAAATSWLRNNGFLLIFELCDNAAAASFVTIQKIIVILNLFQDLLQEMLKQVQHDKTRLPRRHFVPPRNDVADTHTTMPHRNDISEARITS